jgi:hypothetical protein
MKEKMAAGLLAMTLVAFSAHAESVKRDMPACLTEELLDELLTYVNKGDKSGITQLFLAGQCTILKSGDSVSVISPGIFRATIRYKGLKLFTPSEAFR